MVLPWNKKLSAFLGEISSKNNVDFYCLSHLHSSRTENILAPHKKVCESEDFYNMVIPSEDTKLLDFNQYQKSDKVSFIIYADLECLIKTTDGCKNNPENKTR